MNELSGVNAAAAIQSMLSPTSSNSALGDVAFSEYLEGAQQTEQSATDQAQMAMTSAVLEQGAAANTGLGQMDSQNALLLCMLMNNGNMGGEYGGLISAVLMEQLLNGKGVNRESNGRTSVYSAGIPSAMQSYLSMMGQPTAGAGDASGLEASPLEGSIFTDSYNSAASIATSVASQSIINALANAQGAPDVARAVPQGVDGSAVTSLAFSRLGDRYSQSLAGEEDYTDCSFLSQWCHKQVGVNLPRTAAAQAKYCVDNGLTIAKEDLQPGDLVFFSHNENGRYMDVTHVAIYAGNGMIVDASSSNGEVVYRKMLGGQVLYGRAHR